MCLKTIPRTFSLQQGRHLKSDTMSGQQQKKKLERDGNVVVIDYWCLLASSPLLTVNTAIFCE